MKKEYTYEINYKKVKKYFEPFNKENKPAFIKWHDFAIINNIAFTNFLKNYMIDNNMLKSDEVAIRQANGLLQEIKKYIKDINEKIDEYFNNR